MPLTKRAKANATLLPAKKPNYDLKEAIEILKKAAPVKFDASVDIQFKLNADPNASEGLIRGTTALPHGNGKKIRVIVLSKDEGGKAALDAGADEVGGNELIERIAKGWLDFDAVVASPSMMRDIAKLGKILGPRGLMPSPKAGTVTDNAAQAVKEIKKGRIEFKMDKQTNMHCQIGKLSFPTDSLVANARAVLDAVSRIRPKDLKGELIRCVAISSTMGPGLKLDPQLYKVKESAGD